MDVRGPHFPGRPVAAHVQAATVRSAPRPAVPPPAPSARPSAQAALDTLRAKLRTGPPPPPAGAGTVLQGSFLPGAAATATASLVQLRLAGSGERLPETLRRRMEGIFNADFSEVRVHVGPEAAALGARAFAHGADLYFAPGQYAPATPQGQRLLGHELTHVVQQRAGRARNPFGQGMALVRDPMLEAEAERMALRVAAAAPAGAPAPAVQARPGPSCIPTVRPRPMPATSPVLQRLPDGPADPLKAKGKTVESYDSQGRLWLTDSRGKRWYLRESDGGARWWHPVKKAKGQRGYSVYMRTTGAPVTLASAAAHADALAAHRSDLHWGVSTRGAAVLVTAQVNPEKRRQQGAAMAKYFEIDGPSLSASDYAGEADWEWLHMQGHALGGLETPENLVAGSHGANTEMAAIEKAVGDFKAAKKIDLDVTPILEGGSRLGKPSLKAVWIRYRVTVNGTLVIDKKINARRARMSKAEYDQLERRSAERILKESPLYTIEFEDGGILQPPALPAAAAAAVPAAAAGPADMAAAAAARDERLDRAISINLKQQKAARARVLGQKRAAASAAAIAAPP